MENKDIMQKMNEYLQHPKPEQPLLIGLVEVGFYEHVDEPIETEIIKVIDK